MSRSRVPLVAGNWKMNKNAAEAEAHIAELLPRLEGLTGVEVALGVPFTDLRAAVRASASSQIRIYAQNMHEDAAGAYTGEIAAGMLSEIGVHGVILGHSERRALFGESDRALALKVPAALKAGLTPILCVGEDEQERDAEETERKLRHQVRDDLAGLAAEQLAQVVIAYEPIWAIGTGRVATPEQAQGAISFIRALIADRALASGGDERVAEQARILYGGSVNTENAAELMALPDVDGALVGGASLEVDSFAAVVEAAVGARR